MTNLRQWVQTWKLLISLSLISGGIFFGLFLQVQSAEAAVAFGASPSELEVTVRQGDVYEGFFNLSRNNQDEISFQLESGGGEMKVEFLDPDFAIPQGESSKDVHFRVDTSNLEPGEYEANMVFTPKNQQSSGGTIRLVFAVSTKLKLTVIDQETYSKILRESPLQIEAIEPVLDFQESRKVDYRIGNPTSVFVGSADLKIEILDADKKVVKIIEEELALSLRPGGNTMKSVILPRVSSGKHVARFSLYFEDELMSEKEKSFNIEARPLQIVWLLAIILLITGLTFVTVAFCQKFCLKGSKR